jgi:hypothetical protein
MGDDLREGFLPNLPLDPVSDGIYHEWVRLRTRDDSSDDGTTPS